MPETDWKQNNNPASFALQWLDYLGVKVYSHGKQILVYDGMNPNYEISPLNTRIKDGQDFGNEVEQHKLTKMSFLDFDRLGFAIKRDTNLKWKSGQRVAYYVVRKNQDVIGLNQESFAKSAGLVIRHDVANRRFRIEGENVIADERLNINSGIGPWVNYDTSRPQARPVKKSISMQGKSKFAAMMAGNTFGRKKVETVDYTKIPEVPMIISEEGYVVCMPKQESECQRILVVGASGYGKSLLVNAVSGRLFYKGDKVGWLIDPLNQLYNLSLPQEVDKFKKMISWIGEEPKPLPVIQLRMGCKYDLDIVHEDITFTLTLNFEEFLRKYKFYTYGIKEYDVGPTIRYLNDYINDIKHVSNAEEIKDVMFTRIPNINGDKGMQAMVYKWKNTFETVFKERFTSNLYKNDDTAIDELEIHYSDGKVKSGHPFIMAMEAGLIPVINIAAARRQKWIRNYIADLMQKIVAHQIENAKDQSRIWIIADELNELYEKGKTKDTAAESTMELFRQGRFNRVGFIGNTQSLEKLEPEMYKNASYICCVYMQDDKDRKRLKDFKIDKDIYDQIGDLREMEVMIFRSPKDPFVVYDKYGRRKVEYERRWFRGKIIPPINHHQIPSANKHLDQEKEETTEQEGEQA